MTNATSVEHHRVAVIGAGPGGICTTVRLKEIGVDDIVILERSAGIGGTWQRNRYPGLACDIPSHLYSFSFALNPAWSKPFANQPEILAYLERVTDDFGVRPHVRLNTSVAAARWDEQGAFWELTLGDGSLLRADVVVAGTGMFGPLSYPAIEGRERFAGTAFHTGAWPADHDLSGQRVAVIGSAGTAVQLVPAIAPKVAQLHLFQRSANWVLPKADTPFTPEELERFATDPEALAAERAKFLEYYGATAPYADLQRRIEAEQQCLAQIAVVDDPDLRARLTPTSPWGCQRPLFSNDYYPVFNLPHVELVTDPISAIDERGVITADGRHRGVDTIIYATGYETTRFASVVDFVGRGGVRLEDAWADGARAYLGITMSGFPNLFFLYGPNTNHGSIIFMLECQAEYIARTVGRLEHDDLAWVDVRPEILEEYDADVQRAVEEITVWNTGCHHYYRVESGRIVTQWPYSMYRYREMTGTPDPDAYEAALTAR